MISQYDIATSLVLISQPLATYSRIADALKISTSTAFQSARQLEKAGLLFGGSPARGGHQVNRLALLEFLEHGLRYVFPVVPGPTRLGVPTAHSAPALSEHISSEGDELVWASKLGTVRGRTVTPLIPSAPELATTSPGIYALLTLIDALRVGQARERRLAIDELRLRFSAAGSAPAE